MAGVPRGPAPGHVGAVRIVAVEAESFKEGLDRVLRQTRHLYANRIRLRRLEAELEIVVPFDEMLEALECRRKHRHWTERPHFLLAFEPPRDAIHVVHVAVGVVIESVVRDLARIRPDPAGKKRYVDTDIPDGRDHRIQVRRSV